MFDVKCDQHMRTHGIDVCCGQVCLSPVVFKCFFACLCQGFDPTPLLGLGPFWGPGPGYCELNGKEHELQMQTA